MKSRAKFANVKVALNITDHNYYNIFSPRPNVIKLYVRNLLMFVISWRVFPNRPFQPSLMFVGKAGAYPVVASFKPSTLG
jgi:hypothetical protein